MKSCIRVPRVFLPRENYESWGAPPCSYSFERSFWEDFARGLGETPSVYHCLVPDAFSGEEEERIQEARENMYEYLESGALERLNRGMIYTVRTSASGAARRGILASVDLEEVSFEGEKGASVRSALETIPEVVQSRMRAREAFVLEFPHVVLLYRDKKDKILRALDDELELLFDVPLGSDGGRLVSRYIPEEDSILLAHDLIARADPCFLVADGAHELAGAKAHWEEIKRTISPSEARNHPARYLLAEFVNGLDEALAFEPLHRRVRGIEPEAFCDYFARKVKCKRQGNVLFPILTDAESYRAADSAIFEFLKQNTGAVDYSAARPALLADADSVVVALPAPAAEDLYAAVKSGKRYPARAFRLKEPRFSFEGREISYD